MNLAQAAEDFKTQYEGEHIDEDGYYGAQCWDLVARFAREKIGCPYFPTGSGGAEGVFRIFQDPLGQYFDRVANNPNDPNQVPPKGAIVVFMGSFSPPWGHIALNLGADPNGMTLFEQNGNNPGGVAYIKRRGWTGVSGWLVAKNKGDDMVPDENHLQAMFRAFRGRSADAGEVNAYVGKWSYDAMVEALDSGDERQNAVNNLNTGALANKDNWPGQIYSLQDALKAANQAVAESNAALTAARQQLQDIGSRPSAAELKALQDQLADAEKKAMEAQAQYEKAHADLLKAQKQTAADTATGNSFLRWLGGILGKKVK